MPDVGIELTTYRLQGGCSTTELIRLNCLVEGVGIEPTDLLITSLHLSRVLHYRPARLPNLLLYSQQQSLSTRILVVIEGIDPSSSAYETATHPSTSYHPGVSNENRTRDSGITTRGFTTKLWTPYRNTLSGVRAQPVQPLYSKCVFIWQTHCGQASNLHSPT